MIEEVSEVVVHTFDCNKIKFYVVINSADQK